MTALAMDVRELSFDEIERVAGTASLGDWIVGGALIIAGGAAVVAGGIMVVGTAGVGTIPGYLTVAGGLITAGTGVAIINDD